jgi:hypothetical protein
VGNSVLDQNTSLKTAKTVAIFSIGCLIENYSTIKAVPREPEKKEKKS